ncbi:Ku protein [Pseudonocardia cypriaca]|uniref:Non-homologous end joining protein Ku n=1 Tax=Pseudonocardia cypriaca TaxID=882449 RepID=A0A543FUV4_9PSEU|nr:Ku protein [Pseudonocardia cypriaca]TQM37618.1 DNA end-binding protein Ku [Pseudonocardia cypriaca]
MARAIWTGAISFGLVSIPVGLFSATEDHTIHFHQFERGTSDRIRNQRINERTGKEVEYSDIVKGKEVGDGEYVIVEPEELADIAPGRSRTIDIQTFVDLDEIDPIYFQKTYWLAPTDERYERPYALLREAMTRTNRAGVATFVMRGKEYLTALRADGDVLALETLFFADEIRDRSDLDLPGGAKPKGKELDMATGLIEAMSGPWKPDEFRDTFTERVEKLIEDKRKGREIVTEAEPPEPTAMSDLIAALERSVDAARRGGKPKEAPASSDLSELSKTDLAKMARELDVKGRSSMSREELEKAVAAAASQGRKKAS